MYVDKYIFCLVLAHQSSTLGMNWNSDLSVGPHWHS